MKILPTIPRNKEARKAESLLKKLMSIKPQPFPEKGKITGVKTEKGVYIIYSPKKIVSHVGNTPEAENGLLQRLNNHVYGQSSYAHKFLKPQNLTVREGYTFAFVIVADPRIRVFLEALACGLLCPEHIGTRERGEKSNKLNKVK